MAGAGYKLFNTGDVLTAAQVNTYLQEQTVMVFASATARTTALSGVLAEGMMSYLQDTNAVEVYDGSAWVSIGSSGDITAVNVSSPITGGGSSGAVTISIQDGTTTQKGAVQLEDSTSSTSTTKAATPNSVKSAYDLANGAIAKSLVDAAGDLIYATAADTVTRLGIGTAGQVLKVNSGATAPEWGAAGGAGGLTFIKKETFSSVGAVNVNDVFSSTYLNYKIIWTLTSSDAEELRFRLRVSGSDSTSNYNISQIRTTGASTSGASQETGITYFPASFGATTGVKAGDMTIYNPFEAASTRVTYNHYSQDASGGICTGRHSSSTSYTGFSMSHATYNITGTILVYGFNES